MAVLHKLQVKQTMSCKSCFGTVFELFDVTLPFVHRDLKQDNIAIDKNNKLTILDFGLVCHSKTALEYESPDYRKGKVPESSADMWSAGNYKLTDIQHFSI